MSPPIRDGSGDSIGTIRLGDGTEISEVRTGAGDVLFTGGGPPNAVIAQFEQAGSTNITEATPYSMIAVAAFDNNESGFIWQASLANGDTVELEDRAQFDLAFSSGSIVDLVFGTVSASGLVIITTTVASSGNSKIFVNGTLGEQDNISPPDLDGTFTADDAYSNTFEETLVYNEDIDATGLRTDEEQRLAGKHNITL